jgi:hypothetical protein
MTHIFTDFQQFLQQNDFQVYWISLYMFQMVFLPIIRSSRLYTQHQVYVIQVSWLLASGHKMELFLLCCRWSIDQLVLWEVTYGHDARSHERQISNSLCYILWKRKEFRTFAWFFHMHSGNWCYII